MTTISEVLADPRRELLYLLEVDLYDPVAEATTTRRYAWPRTVTIPPGDSLAACQVYSGRLEAPDIPWQRFAGDRLSGDSSPSEMTFRVLDLEGTDSDIAANQMTVDGQAVMLRIGTTELDTSAWLAIKLEGRNIQPFGVSEGYTVNTFSPERPFEKKLPRRQLLGLGECLAFDRSAAESATISHDAALDAGAEITIEAIIELETTGVLQSVLSKGPISTSGEYALYVDASDWPRVRLTTDAGSANAAGPRQLVAGERVRLTGRWNSSDLECLIDGEAGAASALGGTPVTTTTGLVIGDDSDGGAAFDGRIDDLRLFSVARTDAQVTDSMHRELADTEIDELADSLVFNLRCNEGQGETAYDDTFHGHDATLADGDTMWSSLLEGDHGQTDRLPVVIGVRARVPGVWLSTRSNVLAVHDAETYGPCVRLGPVDVGGGVLWPKRSFTATDWTVTPQQGLSAQIPIHRISSGGQVDLGGLRPGQWLQTSTGPNAGNIWRIARPSTSSWVDVFGTASSEGPAASFTLSTVGWSRTSTSISFDGTTISSTSLSFVGLIVGQTLTVSGSASNDGTVTIAGVASTTITTLETLTTEAAGNSITLTANEIFDYEVSLSNGTITFVERPTLPVAVYVQGPGDDRPALQMDWIAKTAAGLASSKVDTNALEALASSIEGKAGLYVSSSDDPTLAHLMNLCVANYAGSWGHDLATGKITARDREIPASAALTLDDDLGQVLKLSRDPARLPITGQRVVWGPNDVPLGEDQVAGTAFADDRAGLAFAREPSREVEATVNPSVADAYPSATEGPVITTTWVNLQPARILAQREYDRDSVPRGSWRSETALQPLALDVLDDGVLLKSSAHPELAAGGRIAMVVELVVRASRGILETVWWG